MGRKMTKELIQKAVSMGTRVGYALVATCDDKGLPHLAASGKIEAEPDGHIGVSEWFCPGTLSNLEVNPRISIVVWDPATDAGFQLIGESVGVLEMAILDGFIPSSQKITPQVERKIRIRVDKIMDFSHAPHSDEEEP
jgi:hypothetical protein